MIGIVLVQDAARARENARRAAPARARAARARRSALRARSSCSRDTTTAPRRCARRPDDPADAQAWQPVRLRQAARDDHAIGAAPHRRRFAAVELGAAIDFVGQNPAAVPRRRSRRCDRDRRPRTARRSGCSDCRSTISLVRGDTSRSRRRGRRSIRHRGGHRLHRAAIP